MPVSVKTYTTLGEAGAALAAERGSRYIGGGTLVMRALNEGDLSLSSVVRVTFGSPAISARPCAFHTTPAGMTHGAIESSRKTSNGLVEACARRQQACCLPFHPGGRPSP